MPTVLSWPLEHFSHTKKRKDSFITNITNNVFLIDYDETRCAGFLKHFTFDLLIKWSKCNFFT